MASPPLRIAILECDTPVSAIYHKYGSYGNIFYRLIDRAACSRADQPKIAMSTYDVVRASQFPELEDIDAVLISGSKYNSFDDYPWILNLVAFVQRVLAQRQVRIIGVCFGHQIVGRALAGDEAVGRSTAGWELSVTDINLTPRGREVFGMTKLALHQMHQDVVYKCPDGVETLASTHKCAVQSMYIPQRLLTVQGHPEFNEEISSQLLNLRHDSGTFDDQTFTDAIQRVDRHHDGVAVAEAFLRFLLD